MKGYKQINATYANKLHYRPVNQYESDFSMSNKVHDTNLMLLVFLASMELVWKKTRMTWNLILKFFSLLILVVEALYLMNPTDATLSSLSVLKYSRWRPKWPSVRLLRPIQPTYSIKSILILTFYRCLRG